MNVDKRSGSCNKLQEFHSLDEHQRAIFTNGEIDEQGQDRAVANLHSHGRQPIEWFAKFEGFMNKPVPDLLNGFENLLAAALQGRLFLQVFERSCDSPRTMNFELSAVFCKSRHDQFLGLCC